MWERTRKGDIQDLRRIGRCSHSASVGTAIAVRNKHTFDPNGIITPDVTV